MVEAETLMRQAGYTAHMWLDQAIEAIEPLKGYSHADKAVMIAAFMNAAAQDQHTMTLRTIEQNKG